MCIRDSGNATHTALSYDMLGEDVLITGAGPIGIMAAAIAKFAGARHVVITEHVVGPVSYTHLDVYKRQVQHHKSRIRHFPEQAAAIRCTFQTDPLPPKYPVCQTDR